LHTLRGGQNWTLKTPETWSFLRADQHRQCEETAQQLGAIPQNSVTQKLDYLIIGELSSRDWRFSSYGRKIEKAMLLQEKGHSVRIVTEEAWLAYASALNEPT
ncbi:BRCT domain-containing protein, partial [Aeromonas enteropelogenes]|uniref:BRCT domain-containing protein n=1 Tax=Aeromonas enteropelogenes TaxID=29489 RepID=UPI003988A7AE